MLNDESSKLMLLDVIDYRVYFVKKYLEKLPEKVPKTYDVEYFNLEHNVESFLFFANLAIENLSYKINKKLDKIIPRSKYISLTVKAIKNPADKEIEDTREDEEFFDNLTIYQLRKKLDTSNEIHIEIKKIIDKYFSTPEKHDGKIDVTNSPLWILRELRNITTHS